jgi:hypothetical protein
VPVSGVRYGLGREGRFGPCTETSFRFFDFHAPNRALRATENPRVDGSIPSLAAISNSMICNGFRASPADPPWPSMADPRTNGKWVGAATRSGARASRPRDVHFQDKGCLKPEWFVRHALLV